ncbi:MAG TPA: hypothetical protein VEA41_21515 [Salinarimonas sp.]|nr:hypothetical protein [Salinarimonas sp.]
MTALASPVEPHELPPAVTRSLADIVRRVTCAETVAGNGSDLLLRVYLAGFYHGLELEQS